MSGLTRRQAREQEKIRTASVPIISPDLEPASSLVGSASPAFDAPQPAIFRPAAPETPTAPESPTEPGENETPSVVNPALGAELLGGASPDAALPASFDQLLARSSTGATGTVSTPNSLILSQTPTGVPLVGPVTATGEIMITGTFDLPEGLGSVGHAPGTTDGRDADAVLLDGELPAASSPTPIAASAAISTVKQPRRDHPPPGTREGEQAPRRPHHHHGHSRAGSGCHPRPRLHDRSLPMTATTNGKEMAQIAALAADAKGGDDLVALDVSEPLPSSTCSSSSPAATSATSPPSPTRWKKAARSRPQASASRGSSGIPWVLLDFGDLVVHVFHEEERVYYGLERLWKDCPVVPLEIPTPAAAD